MSIKNSRLYHRIVSLVHATILKLLGNICGSMSISCVITLNCTPHKCPRDIFFPTALAWNSTNNQKSIRKVLKLDIDFVFTLISIDLIKINYILSESVKFNFHKFHLVFID